jgi:RND family efflux transporter MFP subunit
MTDRFRAGIGAGMKGFIAVSGIIALSLGLGATWYFGSPPPSKATAAAERTPRVDIIKPRRAAVAQRLQSNATLEAFEEADLYAKVSGYLSQVPVDIGDRITAGQILAVVDIPELSKELAETEAQLDSRRRSLEVAERQIERNKADLALQEATLKRRETLGGGGRGRWVSDQELDEIRTKTEVSRTDVGVAQANRALAAAQVDLAAATVEKTRAMFSYSKIAAPFDGIVSQRWVNRGDLVQAATSTRTTPLLKVQRVDIIRVFCDVPENEVAQVRVGDPATVKPIGLNGAQFTGTVTRFASRLDPQTRNMRTEIDLTNADGRLYPGMYAEVLLEMNRHPDVLTVPASAVSTEGSETFVYTVKSERIERVPVKLGVRDAGGVEIAEGLSEQTTVVMAARTAPPVGTVVQTNIAKF